MSSIKNPLVIRLPSRNMTGSLMTKNGICKAVWENTESDSVDHWKLCGFSNDIYVN